MIPRLWYHLAVPLLMMAVISVGVSFFLIGSRPRTYELSITGGAALGRRHELAQQLAAASPEHGVALKVVPTQGSADALAKVAVGEIDVALVQGGISPRPGVRQVGALFVEALHLLVRVDLKAESLGDLRGCRINLSTPGSGTRLLATGALTFAGLEAGRDYQDMALSYTEIETLATAPEPAVADLPEVIFAVSSMPFPLAEKLIQRGLYRLMAVPLAPALSIRDFMIHEATIPAMAYRVAPPEPPQPLATVGTQLLLVANEKVDERAVAALLETVFAGEFARASNLAQLDEAAVARAPEYPLHKGTRRWLARNQPVLTNDTIEGVENLRSLLVSIAVAVFLVWRWNHQRRILGFEPYLAQVNEIERKASELEDDPTLDLRKLIELRREISRLKTDALDKFVRGNLKGEELMASFLAHVSDTRESINNLILHERGRLERLARSDGSTAQSEIRLGQLWQKALGEGDPTAAGKS